MSDNATFTPHDHPERVEGCFRCELSRNELGEYVWGEDDDKGIQVVGEREGMNDWGPTQVIFYLSGSKADREDMARWLLKLKVGS